MGEGSRWICIRPVRFAARLSALSTTCFRSRIAVAGRLAEAAKFMARMRELDPVLRISNLKDLLPLRRVEDFAKWAEALRKAGLPE